MTGSMTNKDFHQQISVMQDRFDAMEPELEVTVRDPSLNLEGFVVVWNTAISVGGPLNHCGKGGTRIRSGLSLDEVKALARTMAIKNAAAGLPLGGAKSGINADPGSVGFEKKYRKFVSLCKPLLHENGGIFGGFGFDIGARPEHAIWACDTLGSKRSFTGKPLELGGTNYDQEGIAGLGVAEAASTLIASQQEDVSTIKFAVHGLGAMGAAVIRYFSMKGAVLSGIGDPKYHGTWEFKEPPSNQLLAAIICQDTVEANRLLSIEGTVISVDPNQILFQPIDVLFPCALQSVITVENVFKVKSRYIVEGANGPCDSETFPVFHEKGIQVVPDFIANSGGIIAAYVELTNGDDIHSSGDLKVKKAKNITRDTISNNTLAIVELSQRHNVSLRDAGLYIALDKVLNN